jgi:hypothetical protein
MVESIIRSLLLGARKKTISLGELERAVEGGTSYEEFAGVVNELVKQGILVPKSGSNHKPVALALSYRIIQSKLSADHLQEIENCHFTLHPLIELDVYYNLPPDEWKNDLPYIERINTFLNQNGLPEREATAPEWSYALTGDEKWIDEKGGKRLLDKVGLLKSMKIIALPDPLMLAVNQAVWNERTSRHLIVENKTPFHWLLDYLPDTGFLSLIYGAGWKITADILMLDKQLGLKDQETRIYYFGDLDYEGISIWHALSSRRPALPAAAFYRALLAKPWTTGKATQVCNEEALNHFLQYFSPEEQNSITRVLQNGGYYPQEGLSRSELGDIWRNTPWN